MAIELKTLNFAFVPLSDESTGDDVAANDDLEEDDSDDDGKSSSGDDDGGEGEVGME